MACSTIDLDFLKHFAFLLLEIYACFWHLPHPLWTLRHRIQLIFFFLASSGSKSLLPFLWPLVPCVLKHPLFISTSYVIYLVLILHLCLPYQFFTLSWFYSLVVRAFFTWYTYPNAPSLPLNDLPNTGSLPSSPSPLPWYLLPCISYWLIITYLNYPFFSFSFPSYYFIHCHSCHDFSAT